jgi:hypothetical protein
MSDYATSPGHSNQFYFGRNLAGELRNLCWAVVNGWLIPVTGTKTGAPPLAANDTDSWNRITLSPPPSSTGGNRAEFVFLEVWLARIDVDPSVGVAPGKPARGYIYKFGNVGGGFSFLPDDLIDPNINFETNRRVQLQYRIRTVLDVGLSGNPEGFDPTMVFAQGQLTIPSVVPFTNMRQALGDPGLWRAGTGDPATFGTADGYVYAVPLCAVFRRNTAAFSDTGNLAGAFNRNSTAIVRDDATTFTSGVALPTDITDVAVSFTLTSVSGTVLATINDYGEAYFRVDDEIIRVTNVLQTSPVTFMVSIDRGQLGSTVRSHKSGTPLNLYTVRPDGLYADQVSQSDILDMRHSVADKFDYEAILRTNLSALLRGRLRSTWKRYGSTLSGGSVILYGDRITDSSVYVGGLTRLDAPDGNRCGFSDAAVMQRFNVPVTVPTNSVPLSAPVQVTVAPFNIEVDWTATPPVHTPGNRLYGGTVPMWWNGDQLTILLSSFIAGIPGADADQVRFVLPSEDLDSVIVRFEGMTTDPNGGNPSSTPATSPTATNPYLTLAPTGVRIMKHGQGITVSLDGSNNLVVTLASGTTDTALQEFIDALQGNTAAGYVAALKMHIEFTVLYGAGRGLSHRPEFVHTVQYRGSPVNASRTLLRDGLVSGSRMVPTYLGDSPLVQVGVNRAWARTSEIMVDPGSKTVWIAPYREMLIPNLLCRSAARLNWYGGGPTYQGTMPLNGLDGITVVHPNGVDPLDLFYNGTSGRYVEVPPDYLPKLGLHHQPIVPTSNTIFSSGLNFLLMAKEGAVAAHSDFNRNLVSYPNAPGYCIVTPLPGEIYGTASGGRSIFGRKYINSNLTAVAGGPFRGIQFPPFLAPARITGIYLRAGTAVVPASSPFDNSRTFVGGVGTNTNLLRDGFDGPTLLLDVVNEAGNPDVNGDVCFILNADIIDLSKAPAGTTFDDPNQFIIECVLFGFDRGFLQTNGRILCAKSTGGGTVEIAVDTFTSSSDSSVGIIAPAPLTSGAANNEVTIYYSHVPYQGDPFGTQSAYSDDPDRRGPLSLSELNAILGNPLGPVSALTLPNKAGYEVLATQPFVTSLGTGRLSGSVPIPLMTVVNAPRNPPDYAGTRIDLQRRLAANRVGYEDWVTPKLPVTPPPYTSRPVLKTGALSEAYDHDVHPELAGCTSRLPLGALFRDKDFSGKTLYQAKNATGVGSIVLGTLALPPFEASMAKAAEGRSTWEGVEFVCGNASGSAGAGSEALVRVDGTSVNPSDVQVFKTTRGGAAYNAANPWPGGIVSARFPKARPNIEVGSVMTGIAYLVRTAPEVPGMSEVHPGHELQMMIVTQAIPTYFRDTDLVHSASGTNEGYTAADRFRLLGKPIEKRRGVVDASTIPASRSLFVNKIFDDPLYYGSSDIPPVSQKQETLAVTSNGQTIFTLSQRPLDPMAVVLYLNGVKLRYGTEYTVGGPSNTTVTYVPSGSTPPVVIGDVLEAWFLLF